MNSVTCTVYNLVCGFEAFINGKHIVGEVKEKEQAHKEYREAISQGHGAYLMDEETPVCVCTRTCMCASIHVCPQLHLICGVCSIRVYCHLI